MSTKCFSARPRGKYFPLDTENSKCINKLTLFFKGMILHICEILKKLYIYMFWEKFSDVI